MTNSNGSIAIVPVSQFKWTAQIQYKESLFTRDEAIRYASEHDCNLIVQYEKRSGPLFDALHDPNLDFTFAESSEAVETVPVLETRSINRGKRMIRGVFGFARLFSAAPGSAHEQNAMPAVHSQALAVK